MPSFGIFDQKCVIWVFLDNNFKRTIVIFEISTLKVVYLRNFAKKQKRLNLGPKMPHLGIFGLEFEKTNVLFEISTLKFVKSESLFHTVNFGIGSAFSKGPQSAFSEGPGPGLGLVPLYKVCRLHAHKWNKIYYHLLKLYL